MTDYKEVSLNVIHSSLEITEQFYSNLNDGEVQNRIGSLGKETKSENDDLDLIREFLEWKKKRG